ncbi:cobalt-precorrin-6A reductase [Rhizorhapis sp.]|uniref:cobalt-precorrin-6A reductase n=1 Tax=Rhizorhapis sp. TaxID=1968842 RepID=UPI002B4660E4|nr:cobalt-precorrin-6A reductase [Rhizorhapis sp.]HKR15895.1 cobalt-precorrin-6A reductase [Rhizorhapis sp.]
MHNILILGGTTEARQLAERLAGCKDLNVTLSLAGRTRSPIAMPVPVRSGGFGGAEGLARWVQDNEVGLLIDATHPFAANMSRNAAEASGRAGIPLLALRRPAWQRQKGDRWIETESPAAAIAALGKSSRRVFLALGRQEAHVTENAPWHHYLVRSVEPIDPPLSVPHASHILDRGPFDERADLKLLRDHRIDAVVAKNSGGTASYAKIAAARALGIEVMMIQRPDVPDVPAAADIDAALEAIGHALGLAFRGV